jgi:hypothetical protein
MTDAMARYFEGAFFDELRQSSLALRPPSVQLAELWGVVPLPEWSRFVDFLGAQPSFATPELGAFRAFAAADFVPSGNTLRFMLTEPFRRAALFTGTVALGCTGAGDAWLVEVESPHRVFLHDHDSGALIAVADGLQSFAWACHLQARDEATTEAWRELAGRVRGTHEFPVPEGLAAWANDGVLEARHRSAGDLRAALEHGPHFTVADVALERASAPGLVSAALRSFLHEDPALEALRQRAGHRGYEARLRALQ